MSNYNSVVLLIIPDNGFISAEIAPFSSKMSLFSRLSNKSQRSRAQQVKNEVAEIAKENLI